VAAPWGGVLRYVATVRTGFTDQDRRRLPAVLAARACARPIVRCPHGGLWVKPELVCEVKYLEWTRAGRLRGASFHRLLAAP
jgi:bifunctional non-homologous end joining protein LigD